MSVENNDTAIPNYNSFSTIMDRIIIEQVKKTIFEHRLEECEAPERRGLQDKIHTQIRILKHLRREFVDFNLRAYFDGEYKMIKETRTFG